MTHDRNISANRSRAGFSLIEVVIVVVVGGILAAAVTVNWASFMRYQELRQDALSLHKEIMALKARAMENGDSVGVNYTSGTGGVVTVASKTDTGWVTNKTISLNDRVSVSGGAISGTTGLPPISTPNNWAKTGTPYVMYVIPDNLNAYDNGWLLVKSTASKQEFCILVYNDSIIKPEIYNRSSSSGTWRKQ